LATVIVRGGTPRSPGIPAPWLLVPQLQEIRVERLVRAAVVVLGVIAGVQQVEEVAGEFDLSCAA
jgi:hypothetical protein